MRIEFQGSPNTTMIGEKHNFAIQICAMARISHCMCVCVCVNRYCADLESARSLELVVSQSKYSIVSLLGTMDRCVTPMGRRLLRASILQPPCDDRLIENRQSCVAELVANRSLSVSLQVIGRSQAIADAFQSARVSICLFCSRWCNACTALTAY